MTRMKTIVITTTAIATVLIIVNVKNDDDIHENGSNMLYMYCMQVHILHLPVCM